VQLVAGLAGADVRQPGAAQAAGGVAAAHVLGRHGDQGRGWDKCYDFKKRFCWKIGQINWRFLCTLYHSAKNVGILKIAIFSPKTVIVTLTPEH
jgi:hypothetical protein